MRSASKVLRRNGQRLYGADTIRVLLVLGVIAYQSIELSESYAALLNTPAWILPSLFIPALFAISGFLLVRSRQRHDLRNFVWQRLRRVLPPFLLIVLIAAIILGPVFTSLPIGDYFKAPGTARYLLNLIALPRFELPGVFEFNNQTTLVNEPLWSAPVMIIGIAVLALSTAKVRFVSPAPVLILAIILGVAAGVALSVIVQPGSTSDAHLIGRATAALLCFLLGALASEYPRFLPIHWSIAAIAIAAIAGAALTGSARWGISPIFGAVIAVPVAYLAIYFSLTKLPLRDLATSLRRYLGAAFLYAYPVQQVWITAGSGRHSALTNLALSLPVIALLAALTSHLVQRRIDPGLDRPPLTGAEAGFWPNGGWRRISMRDVTRNSRALAPGLALTALMLLLALSAMALTMFAMQRDPGGI